MTNTVLPKLYMVTEMYPFGPDEDTFIPDELDALAKRFDVTIISSASEKVYRKYYKSRLSIVESVDAIWIGHSGTLVRICSFISFFFSSVGIEEILQILRLRKKILVRIRKSAFFYMNASIVHRFMRKSGCFDSVENNIYYTYWNDHTTLALIFEKIKRKKNMRIISRIHGGDLYNERCTKTQRQPFKKCMDKYEDLLIFVSDKCRDYYIDMFSEGDTDRYIVSRIGAPRNIPLMDCNMDRRTPFELVSCSAMLPLKRIELLIDALSEINEERIRWIHFGDGPERELLFQRAKERLGSKNNIQYEFKGFIPREEIERHYADNCVGAFITTSSTEGLPVSIMEAIAYGIPIIATDVGGISEMIEGNGILLTKDPTSEDIAKAIRTVTNMSGDAYMNMRRKSEELWRKYYNSNMNAEKLSYIVANRVTNKI